MTDSRAFECAPRLSSGEIVQTLKAELSKARDYSWGPSFSYQDPQGHKWLMVYRKGKYQANQEFPRQRMLFLYKRKGKQMANPKLPRQQNVREATWHALRARASQVEVPSLPVARATLYPWTVSHSWSHITINEELTEHWLSFFLIKYSYFITAL